MAVSSPQIYVVKKIERELDEVSELFFSVMKPNFAPKDWLKISEEDRESIYKIRISFSIIASLMRRHGWFLDMGNIRIKILRERRAGDSISQVLFTKSESEKLFDDVFKNKVKDEISIKGLCDYFIHEGQSSIPYCASFDGKIKYLDNLPMIYCAISTDKKKEIFINIEDFINKVRAGLDLVLGVS